MSVTNYSEYKEVTPEGTFIMDLHLESVMGHTSSISFDEDFQDVLTGDAS